jgi:hypothetical protein
VNARTADLDSIQLERTCWSPFKKGHFIDPETAKTI